MLKELESEVWEADNLENFESDDGPCYDIMEGLSKYVAFSREFLDNIDYWHGEVLSNNSRINLMQTKRENQKYHLAVPFVFIKGTSEEELETIREVFKKYGLKKQN
jgi:hypothetical protein